MKDLENIKCNRCGHLLVVDSIESLGEGDYGDTIYLSCPYCGAKFECVEPNEEDKKEFDFYSDGEPTDGRFDEIDIMNGHCINCGTKVSMSNNFMLSDYDDSITDVNDDKMNFILNQCPYCGIYEVRWDNSENEKKNFPYWREEV